MMDSTLHSGFQCAQRVQDLNGVRWKIKRSYTKRCLLPRIFAVEFPRTWTEVMMINYLQFFSAQSHKQTLADLHFLPLQYIQREEYLVGYAVPSLHFSLVPTSNEFPLCSTFDSFSYILSKGIWIIPKTFHFWETDTVEVFHLPSYSIKFSDKSETPKRLGKIETDYEIRNKTKSNFTTHFKKFPLCKKHHGLYHFGLEAA